MLKSKGLLDELSNIARLLLSKGNLDYLSNTVRLLLRDVWSFHLFKLCAHVKQDLILKFWNMGWENVENRIFKNKADQNIANFFEYHRMFPEYSKNMTQELIFFNMKYCGTYL